MLLKDFIPAQEVQEFVQLYRIVHLQFNANQPIPVKAYPPRPEHCLAFYPFDTETVEYNNSGKIVKNIPVVLYGQFSEVTNRTIGHNFLVFQIIFYPGALHKLTAIHTAELTNQYLDAECIFNSELRNVNDQLHHAKSYSSMLDIANAFVKQLIKKQKKQSQLIDQVARTLLNMDGKITLENIAKQCFLSTKQLERNFKERTGVNPKLYEKIIRFDKAFRLKNSKPHLDWLRIAMECNYHDYQHLAKDYKNFTSLSPTSFHKIEDNAPERIFGFSEGL